MHADSYFQIGAAHIKSGMPCQDYAIARVEEEAAIAIVSDGCSSGGLTDVGARVLAHTMARMYNYSDVHDRAPLMERIAHMIATTRYSLGLDWRDMLATVVYAIVDKIDRKVVFYGDGTCIVRYPDKVLTVTLEFAENAPYYMVYSMTSVLSSYKSVYKGNPAPLCVHYRLDTKDGYSEWDEHVGVDDLERGVTVNIEEGAQQVVIFTDGISNFSCSGSGKEKDPNLPIDTLTGFKNVSGEYIKRRMARGIRDLADEGYTLMDDIAAAGIYLGE